MKKALNSLEFLVVQEIFMSETAKFANVVLPGASFFEKSGTFTNGERRVQRLNEVIPPLAGTKTDCQIVVDIMNQLETDWESPKVIVCGCRGTLIPNPAHTWLAAFMFRCLHLPMKSTTLRRLLPLATAALFYVVGECRADTELVPIGLCNQDDGAGEKVEIPENYRIARSRLAPGETIGIVAGSLIVRAVLRRLFKFR